MKTTINKLTQALSKMPTQVGVYVAVAATVIGIGGSVLAYGPERPTFTIEKPADHVTFNAITNNPNYGDERNFMLIKDAANTSAGGWSDTVDVQDGKEYIVRLYVHNNAADNLNKVAENTRLSVNFPTNTANSIKIDGFVSASNANPAKVWDDVVMRSDKKFNIAYVQGSSRYHNNVNPSEGFALSDSIATNAGALVGYDKMDGRVPGCFKYSGIATFKIKVQAEKTPNFTIDKKARINNTGEWQDSVTAKPGDKLQYRIAYTNTGETIQNNVVVKDKLPKGVTYTTGSTSVLNANNRDGFGVKVSDNMFAASGINIGNYGPKTNAGIYYNATVPAADKLACGVNKLVNTATVETDNGGKTDTAEVIVNVECQPNECKPGIPEGDERCADVPVAPTTPTELPQTGPAEVILSLIGIAVLAAGIAYWYKSRQDLKKVLAEGATGHGSSKSVSAEAPKLLRARTDTKEADSSKKQSTATIVRIDTPDSKRKGGVCYVIDIL